MTTVRASSGARIRTPMRDLAHGTRLNVSIHGRNDAECRGYPLVIVWHEVCIGSFPGRIGELDPGSRDYGRPAPRSALGGMEAVHNAPAREKEAEIMKTLKREEMHVEHTTWHNEHALWHDDVRVWEKEIEAALVDLKHARTMLENQREMLRKHAGVIRLHELDFSAHEHALADYERGKVTNVVVLMAHGHAEESVKQQELRQTHERIKEHQHTLMVHCRQPLKALSITV